MSDFFSLANHVALVTGGGRGIGMGIAQRLRSAGAQVAVLDRDSDNTNQVAGELAGLAVIADVTRPSDVERAIREVEAALGPIGILVNNAGITGRAAPSWELDVEELRAVLDVNVVGVFNTCKAVVPGMLERGYGRIVNVASIAGKEGNPNLLPYSASKAAVINMTKALAKELAGKGNLCVNAISPAVIKTAMLEGLPMRTIDYMVSRIPIGRTGTIEEVAGLVHYLASPEASFCTGQCYDLSGGRATY